MTTTPNNILKLKWKLQDTKSTTKNRKLFIHQPQFFGGKISTHEKEKKQNKREKIKLELPFAKEVI